MRDDFIGNEQDAVFFRGNVLPRSERASIIRLRYTVFQPRFIVYRNIDTYDLAEEGRVGPRASVNVGFGVDALGSETDFIELGGSASWVHDLGGDSFVSWRIGGATRLQIDPLEILITQDDGTTNESDVDGLIDGSIGTSFRFATPTMFGFGRFAGRAGISIRINETQNRRFFLGGDTTLRTFEHSGVAFNAWAFR